MSEGFTPGPWRACSSGQIVAGAMSRQIARIWNTKNRERDAANAQLIAAGPELLEALESAQMALMGYTHQNAITLAALEKARAAIAKARGTA